MKRYSRRVREEAALICAIAARAGTREHYGWTCVYGNIADAAQVSQDALRLAIHAWALTCVVSDRKWTRVVDAEAEALIRTGWSPSDG